MAPVVIAVAVGAAAAAAGATLMTAIAIGLAAAALYSVATAKIPNMSGTDPQAQKQMIRSANEPYRGIYGRAMTSGPIVYAEEHYIPRSYDQDGQPITNLTETYKVCHSTPETGRVCNTYTRTVEADVKWMHIVLVVAGHPVSSIEKVYFDDEEKTNWDTDYWKINVMDGRQTSINDVPKSLRDVPTWTNSMVGKGLAWVHVMLKYNAKEFPNGIPNIKCLVHGKEVDTPFATGYQNNAAAVIYDYLRYHFRVDPKYINEESFRTEFAICDEQMPSEHLTWMSRAPIRYAIDGGFDYDEPHRQILTKLLTACGGKLSYVNGQYYLQVAAYRGPIPTNQVVRLDDLRDAIDISPDTNLSDRINTVKGQHIDPDRNYQLVDIDPISIQQYVTEDGEVKTEDVSYEFVLNKHQAHRLGLITLKDNRHGLTMTLPLNNRGFKFNVGLPLRFDDPSLGYDSLEFMVQKWTIKPGGGVTLVVKQTSQEIFSDSLAPVKTKPATPNLPNPSYVAPVENLTFLPLDDDNVYDGIVSWSHPDLSTIRNFEIIYTSPEGDAEKVTTTDTLIRLRDMQGVDYTIAVTAITDYSRSQPVTMTANVGSPKAIQKVVFKPENFSVVINPVVGGTLPINTEFLFYRAREGVNPPVFSKSDYIGTGKTFVDTGRKPKTYYNYFIQVANDAAISDAYGPYQTQTTDDPDDIINVIGPSIPKAYTWEVYASDAFGADISRTYDPQVHKFKGIAYNKPVPEPSLNPLDYFFSRIDDYIDPEDQKILDNLANGKTPDGTENLVREDDILFKPGDTVKEVNIADDAISAPKLQANAVTTDKMVANAVTTAKLSVGAVTADKLAARAVTAVKIAANAITSEKIAAEAITADKIAVTVVEPVNNWSQWNSTRGWTLPAGAVLSDNAQLNNIAVKSLKVVSSSSDNRYAVSEAFTVDPGAIYEVRLSVYGDGSEAFNFGLRALSEAGSPLSIDMYHPETLAKTGSEANAPFWSGTANGWRHMVAYLVGASADVTAAPKSKNVSAILKVNGDVDKVALIAGLKVDAGTTKEGYLYSPSVIKLGSGTIVANEIKAGTRITSPLVEGGNMVGTEFNNGNGTFHVDPAGKLTASDATITGEINATSGTFKGRVEASSGWFSGEMRGGSGYFTGQVYAQHIVGDIVTAKAYPFSPVEALVTEKKTQRVLIGRIVNPRPYPRTLVINGPYTMQVFSYSGPTVTTSAKWRLKYYVNGVNYYTEWATHQDGEDDEASDGQYAFPPMAFDVPANTVYWYEVWVEMQIYGLGSVATRRMKFYSPSNRQFVSLFKSGGDLA